MFLLLLDINVLQCFADFIALYLSKAPGLDKIKNYIELKSEEKNIVESYNGGLITQEEVCSFLLGHLYTKFVLNKNEVHEVGDDEIEEFHQKVKVLLFGSHDLTG